jgi:hypothetical protein
MKRVLFAVLLFGGVTRLGASQEGILPLTEFRVVSDGIGASGPVVVSGEQNKTEGIVSLKISAFGKIYDIPRKKLAGLKELAANGIRISYERGYDALGGRTVYVHLTMGFTSGTRKEVVVSVSEHGDTTVGDLKFHDV